MSDFIKKNIYLIILFIITLSIGFLTFLTFIDKGFIELNDQNLQYLLILNIILLVSLFLFIFSEIQKAIKSDIDKDGLKSNKKYITYFALFTLIPSVLISIFSLFLFSFALEKYFDKKVTTVVNNSYELAKNYVPPSERKDIEVLGRGGLGALYSAINEFYLGGYMSEYDVEIAKKVAYVICGGDLTSAQIVSERYLLDIEREGFMSLLGNQKTLDRIQYLLMNNKPLRN